MWEGLFYYTASLTCIHPRWSRDPEHHIFGDKEVKAMPEQLIFHEGVTYVLLHSGASEVTKCGL